MRPDSSAVEPARHTLPAWAGLNAVHERLFAEHLFFLGFAEEGFEDADNGGEDLFKKFHMHLWSFFNNCA